MNLKFTLPTYKRRTKKESFKYFYRLYKPQKFLHFKKLKLNLTGTLSLTRTQLRKQKSFHLFTVHRNKQRMGRECEKLLENLSIEFPPQTEIE